MVISVKLTCTRIIYIVICLSLVMNPLDDLQTRIDKNHAEIDEVLKNFCITGLIANNKK